MRLPDVNVLVNGVNSASPQHEDASRWLNRALDGSESLALPWHVLTGFVRVVTSPRAVPQPLSTSAAMDLVDTLLAASVSFVPEPDLRHAARMRTLLEAVGRGGALVPDAHLAALAIQHRAVLVSFDRDFARFPGLRWETPR